MKEEEIDVTNLPLCPCGCGEPVFPKHKWANSTTCRQKLVWSQIISGEIWPVSWDICDMCKKPFPKYSELYSTLIKKTCSESCRRALCNIKIQRYKEEARWIKKADSIDRSTHCMNETSICRNYDNWLTEPKFFCICTGFDPVDKPSITSGVHSAICGIRVSNGMVARKKGMS